MKSLPTPHWPETRLSLTGQTPVGLVCRRLNSIKFRSHLSVCLSVCLCWCYRPVSEHGRKKLCSDLRTSWEASGSCSWWLTDTNSWSPADSLSNCSVFVWCLWCPSLAALDSGPAEDANVNSDGAWHFFSHLGLFDKSELEETVSLAFC